MEGTLDPMDEDDVVMDGDPGDSEDIFLRKFERDLLHKMRLRGVPGIAKVYQRDNLNNFVWDDVKGFDKKREWVLDTDGSNLMAVLSLDGVDHTRTISNDIVEIIQARGARTPTRICSHARSHAHACYAHSQPHAASGVLRTHAPFCAHASLRNGAGRAHPSRNADPPSCLRRCSGLRRCARPC